MKRLLLLAMLVMGIVLSSSNAVAAQDMETETIADFEEVADLVLDADLDALADELENPPSDRDLPDGFFAPIDGVPENADLVDAFSSGLGDLDGSVANVTHGLDTDPDLFPGLISAGILTYIVTEDEITTSDLDNFAEGMESSVDAPSSEFDISTVEMVEINGEDAVLLTLGIEQDGAFVFVQLASIPVGNAMVVATVVVVDMQELDLDDISPFTAELAVAGVNYLGDLAEDAA